MTEWEKQKCMKLWRYACPLWMLTKPQETQQRRILIIKRLSQPHFLGISQLLSPVISVVSQLFPRGHGDMNESYAGIQSRGLPLTKTNWWILNLSAVKTNTELHLKAGWVNLTAYIMEGTVFCTYWKKHLLWI